MNVSSIDPVKALFWSAVINGVLVSLPQYQNAVDQDAFILSQKCWQGGVSAVDVTDEVGSNQTGKKCRKNPRFL